MERLKKIIKSPVFALGLTPLIFAFSQFIILGYNWLFKGYAGDLTITISRYVGLNLWTSILFAICNFAIITIMFRYYLSLRKSRSMLWFILCCLQVAGFFVLSIFPHNTFITNQNLRDIVNNIHIIAARTMFISMFGVAIETLRLSCPNRLKFLQNLPLLKTPRTLLIPKNTANVCIFFALYGLIYVTVFLTKLDVTFGNTLIVESGYIYSFMAFLLLTRKIRASDV